MDAQNYQLQAYIAISRGFKPSGFVTRPRSKSAYLVAHTYRIPEKIAITETRKLLSGIHSGDIVQAALQRWAGIK